MMRRLVVCVVAIALAACAPRYGGKSSRGSSSDAKLQSIGADFDQGRIDEGLTALLRLDARERESSAFRAFADKHEPQLRTEVERRASAKAWGSAFALASQAAPVFPAVGGKTTEYGRAWADELRPAITEAEAKQRVASVVVLRAALAAATQDSAEAAKARQALGELRRQRRIQLELAATGKASGVQSALATNERFELGARRDGDRAVIKLGRTSDKKDVKRGQATAQVERGTRSVPNPARAQLEAVVADLEDRIENLQEQRTAEQSSPTRTQGNIDTFDYQIGVERDNLTEARQNVADTPATIEQPNLVDVPYEVETHTLTVSREVTLELTAPWAGDLAQQRTMIEVKRSDRANVANPSLGIARDPAELPSPDALASELDQATTAWLTTALDKVAIQYYRRLLVDNVNGDGLALATVLAPEALQRHASELDKTLHVPMADRLIAALAADRIQAPFAELPKPNDHVAATAAQPSAPTPTSAQPGSTSRPGAQPASTSRPGAQPVSTSRPGAQPATVSNSRPAPDAAPADSLRGKAGYKLTIAAIEIKRGTKVVLAVDASGKLMSGSVQIGVVRSNGLVEDTRGNAMLAIDKQGGVWLPRKTEVAGRHTGSKLTFNEGATLTLDASGHFQYSYGADKQTSEAVLSPSTAATKPLALVVAWLGVGKLGLRKSK
jgi:hypothetical protein